jgi:hypothetical protein
MADDGVTFVAAVIVAVPKIFPARLAQLAAEAAPAPSARAANVADASSAPWLGRMQTGFAHGSPPFEIIRRPGIGDAGDAAMTKARAMRRNLRLRKRKRTSKLIELWRRPVAVV